MRDIRQEAHRYAGRAATADLSAMATASAALAQQTLAGKGQAVSLDELKGSESPAVPSPWSDLLSTSGMSPAGVQAMCMLLPTRQAAITAARELSAWTENLSALDTPSDRSAGIRARPQIAALSP